MHTKQNISVLTKELIGEIPRLSNRANMISTEGAIGDFFKGIPSFFTSKIDAIRNVFGKNANRANEITAKDVSQYTKRLLGLKAIAKKLPEQVEASKVAKVKIPVPLGFNTNLLDASVLLDDLLEDASKTTLTFLNTLDTTVSRVLADKEYRESSRPVKGDNAQEAYKTVRKLNDGLGKLIDGNKMKDVMVFGELIPSISSLETIVDNMIKNGQKTRLDDIKAIESVLKVLTEKVNTLAKYMAEDESKIYNKSVIINLADELQAGAELITLSVSVIHVYNLLVDTTAYAVNRIR